MHKCEVSGLRVVDGARLPAEYRAALMPGGTLRDAFGSPRILPRYFYEVPSWEFSSQYRFTPNFPLWELLETDVREQEILRSYPKYVPCAIITLALALQRFRDAVGGPVLVAANGGYRSPRHAQTCGASLHCWGTAANIYRVGNTYLNTQSRIDKFAALAREAIPGVFTRPFGHGPGQTDDHLHLDLGYAVVVPHIVRVESPLLTEAGS